MRGVRWRQQPREAGHREVAVGGTDGRGRRETRRPRGTGPVARSTPPRLIATPLRVRRLHLRLFLDWPLAGPYPSSAPLAVCRVPVRVQAPDPEGFLMALFGPAKSKRIKPAKAVSGSIQLPGDKSISHRYAMLGAIAEGLSEIHFFSSSADCRSTLACLSKLGVDIKRKDNAVSIQGLGLRGLRTPREVL